MTQQWGDPDDRRWHRVVVPAAVGVTLAALWLLVDTFWWSDWP